METSPSIPHIPVTVNEKDMIPGAREILRIIRPHWDGNVHFKLLTDGVTNKLIACSLTEHLDENTVLVRVYGNNTDLLIDRKAETRNIQLLNRVQLAPKLYATFTNGLSYEFIPGNTTNVCTIKQPGVYRLVAAEMARLHRVQLSNEPQEPMIWSKLEQLLRLVPQPFTDCKKNQRFLRTIGPKEKIQEEVEVMKKLLENTRSPVVFCHNDLLLANIIHSDSKATVRFIDFEYTAYNYQAFDIGNHFAEFAGVDNIDYNNYPNKDVQLEWLHTYLSAYKDGNQVTEEEVEQLYVDVNKFCLVSHLFWIFWALIQAEHSYIDFDFIGLERRRTNSLLGLCYNMFKIRRKLHAQQHVFACL